MLRRMRRGAYGAPYLTELQEGDDYYIQPVERRVSVADTPSLTVAVYSSAPLGFQQPR